MPKQWYNITNISDTEAELAIYDEIHPWFGTGARDFYEKLKVTKGKDLMIALNSPGGSVYEGIAIMNMLLNRGGKTKVRIDGIAASIASVIAMAADPGELHMPLNSAMFIHMPLVNVFGNEESLLKNIDELKKAKESIISSYQRHSTLSRDELEEAMREETMYTAEEAAVAFGAKVQPLVKIAAKFDKESLSAKALQFYDTVNTYSENKTVKTKEEVNKPMSEELNKKIALLETENAKLAADKQTELALASTSATQKATDDEKARRDGIKNLLDTYGPKNAKVAELATAALFNGTTVSEFKDHVLAALTAGPSTPAVKPNLELEDKQAEADEKTLEGIQKLIASSQDPVERGRLARKARDIRNGKSG
jgi:ATP-dependent protease ClpP protease subunit